MNDCKAPEKGPEEVVAEVHISKMLAQSHASHTWAHTNHASGSSLTFMGKTFSLLVGSHCTHSLVKMKLDQAPEDQFFGLSFFPGERMDGRFDDRVFSFLS